LPWTQFYYGDMDYYIDIKLKKVPTSGNPRLFKLVAQLQEDEIEPIPAGYQKRPPIIPEQTNAPLTNVYLEQDVFWDDITQNAGVYDWFRSKSFRIGEQTNLQFYIYWYNESDVYVDQIAIYNEKYRDAFITNKIDFGTDVETPLQDAYLNSSEPIDSRLQDFYYDEPFMLTARARGKLQNAIPSILGGPTTIHVNGATGNLPEYFLHFEHKYARESQNAPNKNYVLFNMYPFIENDEYDQTIVQRRLNDLIKCSSFGGSHESLSYNYAGLFPSQIAAQQYDTEPENDLPLFMTLQVHAEHELDANGNYVQNLVGGKRPPTKDEIFAMGNLSLAYGVKGFMYYMVPTRSEERANGKRWGTYGLFDQNEPPNYPKYNYLTKAGTWQNPALEQDTNERYTAVREFISSVKPMESSLLKLKWLGAKYWDETVAAPYPWINSVQTSVNSNFTNPDNEEMVQTGYFEEYSHLTGYNPKSKYIYIVNRRCNTQGSDNSNRYIRFTIDSTVASNYTNIKVTNLKTGQTFFTSKNSLFTLFLNAGDGTLLKFEPTILAGGTLVANETIRSGSNTVDTTLVVPQNVKLTINAGANLTFMKSGKLLILDGQLEVKGTPTNKVEFDFVAKHWSAANGIFAYRTPLKISNAIIKNASCGIYSHVSPGDTIDGVSTENTHTGISLYYSYNYGSDNTVIRNSSFEDSQLWGITMVGPKPRLHNNFFTNITEHALRAYTGSAPRLLKTADTVGNNRFYLNGTSIYAVNSTPILGMIDSKENYIGGNCFYADTTSLWTVNETTGLDYEIDAYGNDWGTTDPSEFRIILGSGITVNTDGFNSDCSGIWLNPNMLSGGSSSPKQMESGGDPDSIKTLIKDVKRMIVQGQLRDALVVLTDIINGTADVRYKKSAVSLIPQCYEFVNMSELKSNLLTIRNVGGLFKFTTMLLMNVDTENMDTYKQEILNAGNNKMYGAGENSEEVMMIYNNLLEEKYKSSGAIDTVGKVTPLLTYLNSNFPTSEYTKSANLLFSEVSNISVPGNSTMNKPQINSAESMEMDYCLYNNYPNPFNPETVIKFSLKEKSNVTLDVYNIAGQKVAELVSGEMEKGFYERKFDGTKLSSGVYIFRLSAQSLENGNLKYSKTMKSLLLK